MFVGKKLVNGLKSFPRKSPFVSDLGRAHLIFIIVESLSPYFAMMSFFSYIYSLTGNINYTIQLYHTCCA